MPSTFLSGSILITSHRVRVGHGRHQGQASPSGRCVVSVQAFSNSATQDYGSAGCTYERVLRYPDGLERRIRYPVPCEGPPVDANYDAGEEWATLNAWKASRGGPAIDRRAAKESASTTPLPEAQPQAEEDAIPNSPLALLRYLTSDTHREAQRREWEEIRGSYEILRGCPWPVPRPLYVLSVAQGSSDAGLTHTLRTRLPRADLENEITRVLGNRRRENGDPLIQCGELTDGVVAFDSEEQAQEYGAHLEDSGALEVSVAQCDSHELFRGINEVKAVVVLMRRGCKVPPVRKLSAVLRGHTALDDAGGAMP